MIRFIAFAGLAIAFLPTLYAQSENHPNIILMMADDMGMGDTSAYQDVTGNSDAAQINTPNMERLARMGVRFTDAHTPTSRCTGTRYGLLTGRYPWRNRMKFWVLFGSQGDPMIERDRPTIASLLKANGYRTGMVGKWHVGLRYRRSDGKPASGWDDADLSQPLFDTPLDHGFDFCRLTSRSHGTSGVATGGKQKNGRNQDVGPGHIHGRTCVSATGNGKELKSDDDPDAYVLSKLGSRHAGNAVGFLNDHMSGETQSKPFFLYYASNSNHSPYTPDETIGNTPVLGASRNKAGEKMSVWVNPKAKKRNPNPVDNRHDFIYENDVVLGQLMDYLQRTDDPRGSGKLIENTIVIFTSDNGAERNAKYATGPFRSNKGSAYEGGHRVPFLVSWPKGGVGDGQAATTGKTTDQLLGLQDMFATFAHIVDDRSIIQPAKGGEDSVSALPAWRGEPTPPRPLFHNDHNEAKDPAATAYRIDNPIDKDGKQHPGKWKLFFDGQLIRSGIAQATELYDLKTDPQEKVNRLSDPALQPLVQQLIRDAVLHRTSGKLSNAMVAVDKRVQLNWGGSQSLPETRSNSAALVTHHDVREQFQSAPTSGTTVTLKSGLKVTLSAANGDTKITDNSFHLNARGLGVGGGSVQQVDGGEAIEIRFNKNVLLESVGIVAGNGNAGGFYQVADGAPLAIYCVDDDIDAKDQSSRLSDLGFLRAGQTLRLDSSPHYGVEAAGRWRLESLTLRVLE